MEWKVKPLTWTWLSLETLRWSLNANRTFYNWQKLTEFDRTILTPGGFHQLHSSNSRANIKSLSPPWSPYLKAHSFAINQQTTNSGRGQSANIPSKFGMIPQAVNYQYCNSYGGSIDGCFPSLQLAAQQRLELNQTASPFFCWSPKKKKKMAPCKEIHKSKPPACGIIHT